MRATISSLFALALAVVTSVATANSIFRYTQGDFTFYEVVVASDEPPKEEPGIYSVDEKGQSKLVVPGLVVGANRNFVGIVAYGPPRASRSSSHDALAVVDGELVVFNRYTDPKRLATTAIVMGDKLRGVEITDVLTGRPVSLPKIDDIGDLVLRTGTYVAESPSLRMGGHFMIASVRAPSHLGDGLTFAFVLENGRTGRPHIMGDRATLISHTFMSAESIDRLFAHQPTFNELSPATKLQIYAPSMISRFKTQIETKSNSPVVKNWIDHIERFEDYVQNGIRSNAKIETHQLSLGIPSYDIFSRRELLPMSPIETITEDQQSVIGQIFNHVSADFGIIQAGEADLKTIPIGKNGSMRFIHSGNAENRQIAHLPVDRDPKTGKHRFLVQADDEGSYLPANGKAYILFSNKSAHLMARPISGGGKDSFVTTLIKNPVLSPEDKIEFLRRPMAVNGHPGSVLLVWRKKFTYADNIRGKKEERAELHALVVDEHDGMQIVATQQLYDGTSPLTFEEVRLRLVEQDGRILFDRVTPVRGAKRYETGDHFVDDHGQTTHARFKTTPYEEVVRKGGQRAGQYWLRTLIEQPIVQDVLTYREYNETGAKERATGFYLEDKPKSDEMKRHTATELKGTPLNNYTGKLNDFPSYTLLAKSLFQPWGAASAGPNVAMTLIPYDPDGEPRAMRNGEPLGKKKQKQIEEDARQFRIALLLSADRIGLTKPFQSVLRSLKVPRPFRDLQFAQVIQGTKNRANEVSILLSFRADPKKPDSVDEVLILTANLSWNNALVNDPFAVQISETFELLHRGLVIPSAVHSHLRVDAEGSYYWVQDPLGDRQSPQYKVTKLTAPAQLVKSTSGHTNLREPDPIRETDVGHVGGKRAVGGRWEIQTAHALSDAIAGLREQSDKRVTRASKKRAGRKPDETPAGPPKQLPSLGDGAAEQQLLTQFEDTLDEFAVANGPHQLRRPRIFVVHPSLKDKFRWSLFTKLALDQSPFSFQNPKLRFFNANQSLDDVEVAEELQYIRETTQEKARILYVEQDQLGNHGTLKMRTYEAPEADQDASKIDADQDELPFPLDEPGARPNMLVLLASGGQAKSLKGFDKVVDRQAPIPMISIVTPDEWRAIQKDQAAEIQAGVLDNVTVDYDYLTTDWTMWSPRTQDKAAQDVKDLAKRPYRSEEMRVFPTLERILNQAARGEAPGKKTLILVPEELKQLVRTLVVVRWATQEPSSGDWSYRNTKLALSRVTTANSKNQAPILDNFRAMRGAAASRHAVLYADLDTIAKVRRPDQDADGRPIYRLKDPVRSGPNAMFGEFDQTPAPESEATGGGAMEGEESKRDYDEGSEGIFSNLHEAELSELREDGTSVEQVNQHIAKVTTVIEKLTMEIDERERTGRAGSDSYERMAMALQDRQQLRREMLEIKRQIEEYQADLAPEDREVPTAPRDPAPHLMWLIAGEGHQIQPSAQAGWSLSQQIDPKITTILIGTPEELEKIETDLQTDAKHFDLRREFDVINLEAPSEETKVKLVQQLFDRPEVVQMGLNFRLKRDNGHDPREQLIYKFINRIDELAYDQKISKTNAFIRAYLALQHHLVDDAELYAHRTVSEKFIERLFTKVFPMPLNREILEPNDPLNRLANEDQAVRDLTQAGVEGSPDLKRRVFENMLSQTRPTDTSRPIPNSQIFFGNTSTGKTFFIERLFKMFGFTEYQSTRSNNEDADYLMIKVSKITAEDAPSSDFVSIKEVLENISDLLAQPKGARAHIVFDDYHTAQSKEVREKLYQFIRGLLESPNGMYVAKRKNGTLVEIPVQNLNLWLTINPQADEAVRRRYIRQGSSGLELLKREVLAAMAGDSFQFEESILARFGDIIDFDKFPRSAKVPELVKRVRQNQIPGGQMVLVDPQVIFNLIDKYPEAHARELLSPATSALTQVPRDVEEGPIYLVSTKAKTTINRDASASGGVSQQDLSKAVRSSTTVETIRPSEPRALESFMGFIMQNFRLQMFNQIVLESSQNDALRLNQARVRNLLKANFVLGMSSHVLDNPRLPLSEISIRHEHFGFYNRVQQQELMRRHEEIKEAEKGKTYFPVEFDIRRRHNSENLGTFISGIGTGVAERRTRRDVLAETVARVEVIIQRAMAHYLRVPSAEDLLRIGSWKENEIKAWFRDLPEDEPEEAFEALRADLVELFKDFHQRINGADLDVDELADLDFYTQVRLYAYAIDKAITRLPWGQIGNFVINVAAQSSDSSLGARTSYRNYVSKQQLSAFAIGTPEFMGDMLEGAMNENNHERTPADVERLKAAFREACQTLLVSAGGAK